MAFLLKDSSNNLIYTFPSGFNLVDNNISLEQSTEKITNTHGGVIVGDGKIEPKILTLHGKFAKNTFAEMLTELDNMKRYCNNSGYRLYDDVLHPDEYYPWDGLVSFDWNYLGTYRGVEVEIKM